MPSSTLAVMEVLSRESCAKVLYKSPVPKSCKVLSQNPVAESCRKICRKILSQNPVAKSYRKCPLKKSCRSVTHGLETTEANEGGKERTVGSSEQHAQGACSAVEKEGRTEKHSGARAATSEPVEVKVR